MLQNTKSKKSKTNTNSKSTNVSTESDPKRLKLDSKLGKPKSLEAAVPRVRPIGEFEDSELEEYVRLIVEHVLKPLIEKAPQLVNLMGTSNLAERAAGFLQQLSGDKAVFHAARGGQTFRYHLAILVMKYGMDGAAAMIMKAMFGTDPNRGMQTLEARGNLVKARVRKNKNSSGAKLNRRNKKWGLSEDHGNEVTDENTAYSAEIADRQVQVSDFATSVALPVSMTSIVAYCTLNIFASTEQREDIQMKTITQGNVPGHLKSQWMKERKQRGGITASTLATYLGLLLIKPRADFSKQIQRACKIDGDAEEGGYHVSAKDVEDAKEAGKPLMITDNPIGAGHAWEPVALAYYKIHLLNIAKEKHTAESPGGVNDATWKLICDSIETRRSGLLLHPSLPFLSYSPDASAWCYVADSYIVAEFKFLWTHRTRSFHEIALFYLNKGTNDSGTVLKMQDFCLAPVYAVNPVTKQQEWAKDMNGNYIWQMNHNHQYFWQCIAGMNIGDRQSIDFVAITGSPGLTGVFIQRLHRSDFVLEWNHGALIAEWLWCNQVIQHLTSPLESGNLRKPLASLEEFKKEIAQPGSFPNALTWKKITEFSEQIKRTLTIR